jgi:hypothetical protein
LGGVGINVAGRGPRSASSERQKTTTAINLLLFTTNLILFTTRALCSYSQSATKPQHCTIFIIRSRLGGCFPLRSHEEFRRTA